MKQTTDADWAQTNGVGSVDIANTPFDRLPADWQAENRDAASVLMELLTTHPARDPGNAQQRHAAGAAIHRAWLSRNTWAAGGALDVPFDDLPHDEQDKDINQIVTALRLTGLADESSGA
jgi:hypothetical protein